MWRRWARRSVMLLHRWAESGWAGGAVGTWGLLQASVVPGPAEALLLPLGLSDPRRAFRLAAWALAGAVCGGLVAYAIGAFAFEDLGRGLLSFMGVGDGGLERARVLFDEHGWKLVLLSAVTPISTKWMCIAAGAFGVPFVQFGLALLGGRTARFLAVALVIRFAGARLAARMAVASGAD